MVCDYRFSVRKSHKTREIISLSSRLEEHRLSLSLPLSLARSDANPERQRGFCFGSFHQYNSFPRFGENLIQKCMDPLKSPKESRFFRRLIGLPVEPISSWCRRVRRDYCNLLEINQSKSIAKRKDILKDIYRSLY